MQKKIQTTNIKLNIVLKNIVINIVIKNFEFFHEYISNKKKEQQNHFQT